MREVLEDSEIPKDMNFIHFLTSSVSEIPRTIETLCLGRRNHNSSHETRRWRGRAIAPVLLKHQRVVNHADLAKSQIVTQEVWGGAGGSTFLTSSQAGGYCWDTDIGYQRDRVHLLKLPLHLLKLHSPPSRLPELLLLESPPGQWFSANPSCTLASTGKLSKKTHPRTVKSEALRCCLDILLKVRQNSHNIK